LRDRYVDTVQHADHEQREQQAQMQARPVFLNTHTSIAAVAVPLFVDHLAMVILNDTDDVNPSGGRFHE
jgi:hypothetical protein